MTFHGYLQPVGAGAHAGVRIYKGSSNRRHKRGGYKLTGSAAESEQPQRTVSSNDDSLWHAFATAKTSDVFCRAWLGLLCRQLPRVSAAVVLLEAENARTFVPIAVWPEPVRDLSHL